MTKPRLVPVRGDGSIPPVPDGAHHFRMFFRNGHGGFLEHPIKKMHEYTWEHSGWDGDIAAIEWLP